METVANDSFAGAGVPLKREGGMQGTGGSTGFQMPWYGSPAAERWGRWAFRENAAEARKGNTVIGMSGTVCPLSSRNDDRLCRRQKVNRG